MLYVYCPRLSLGARDLVEVLGATRLRNFDGQSFWRKRTKVRLNNGDTIICWGNSLPAIDGLRVLNGGTFMDKYTEAYTLKHNGVLTVEVSNAYPPDKKLWLPRKNNHVGGNDLLHPPGKADFWSKKQEFTKEYRVHSFDGKSIRAGVKIPRIPNPHPWIRSYDGGWRIDYDGFKSGEALRKVARTSVKALGLIFGAVDIGETADGKLVVLEVNRAPGIEGGSLAQYKKAIDRWMMGAEGVEEAEEKPEPMQEKPKANVYADILAKQGGAHQRVKKENRDAGMDPKVFIKPIQFKGINAGFDDWAGHVGPKPGVKKP